MYEITGHQVIRTYCQIKFYCAGNNFYLIFNLNFLYSHFKLKYTEDDGQDFPIRAFTHRRMFRAFNVKL